MSTDKELRAAFIAYVKSKVIEKFMYFFPQREDTPISFVKASLASLDFPDHAQSHPILAI